MTLVRFVTSDSLIDTLKAINPFPAGAEATPCAFSVGDYIDNPSAPGQFLRVKHRIYYPAKDGKKDLWAIVLEQAQNPLSDIGQQSSPEIGKR